VSGFRYDPQHWGKKLSSFKICTRKNYTGKYKYILCDSIFLKKTTGCLEIKVFAWHVQGPGFNLQHCKIKWGELKILEISLFYFLGQGLAM
jgi:hypothetical protein